MELEEVILNFPGGHVPPERANSDLMRAIEAISGVGLEVPLVSTSANSAADMAGRQVMAIAGFMQIPLIRAAPFAAQCLISTAHFHYSVATGKDSWSP